jgi:hypothetical protein
VPRSYRLLSPEAAAAILTLEAEDGPLSYTDLWRSAELSLFARQEKRGVQPPGFSAHNYGLAIDVDVDGTIKLRGWTYEELLRVLRKHGFYPHNQAARYGSFESWHFNALLDEAPRLLAAHPAPGAAVEQLMRERFGVGWTLDARGTQERLRRVGLYRGELDGDIGPRSKQAVAAFCRAWLLPSYSWNDETLQRTLAFVSAELDVTELAA